jgi:Glycosyl hydrolase family 26
VIRAPLRHPLPGALAGVSILMCVAAACAGLHGIAGPHSIRAASSAAGSLSSRQKPVPEDPVSSRMIGVAGVFATIWDRQTGIHASLATYYLSMGNPVPPSLQWMKTEADRAVPVIEIIPDGQSLAPIAAGHADRWLKSLARKLSTLGERVVIAFAPEANGHWYPGSGHPAQFRAAWRHVWAVLGAHDDDITWLWQMTSDYAVRAYWPGAHYVNWVGIDGYLRSARNTFASQFAPDLTAVSRLTADPVLISETAVAPETGKRPADITALFQGAAAHHVIAVVWFDLAQHDPPYDLNWHLKPGSAAMAAFKRAASAYLTSDTALAGTSRTGPRDQEEVFA